MIQELPNLQHGDHVKLIFSSKRLEHILNVYLNELLELNIQTMEVIKKFFKGVASGKDGIGDENLIKKFETFYDSELFRIDYEFEEMKKSHVFTDGVKIADRIKNFSKEFEEIQKTIEGNQDHDLAKNLPISILGSASKDAINDDFVQELSTKEITNFASIPPSINKSGKTEVSKVRSIIKKSSKSKQSIKKLLIKEGNKNLEKVIVKQEEITVQEDTYIRDVLNEPAPLSDEEPIPEPPKVKKVKKIPSPVKEIETVSKK
jgi:hypothetical protein